MPTISVSPNSEEELNTIAHTILKSRKVVVITGAGISTNLGIPDFRSENGLYALISEQFNKFVPVTEKRKNDVEEDAGPSKRRKLDRSQSMPFSATLNSGNSALTISRRSLRSAKSSLGLEDVPSRIDEEPQSSTVPASRYSSPSTSPLTLPQVPLNVLSNVKGKDLFDAVIWTDKRSTETHYTFITSLKHKIDEVKDTSEVHKFIRVLRDGGRLVRNYTQNIDMLEAREGLCTDMSRGVGSRGRFNPKLRKKTRVGNDQQGGIFDSGVEVVQLHGNLEYLRCTLCLALSDWEEDNRHLTMLAGQAPPCPKCIEKTDKRVENGRRGLSVGTLRPDIVLYGEASPQEQMIGDLSTHDIMLGPDMLIILGTSLRVHGLKTMLREFAKAVHTRGGKVVFVNNTKPPDSVWGDVIDYWIQWDCDEWVRDVKARREEIWLPQGSSRESSPKPQSSQNSQASAPKNPQATRTAQDCGVYLLDRILCTLRRRSTEGETPKDKEDRERMEKLDVEAKERAERITASRLQAGKLLQSQLAAAVSKQAVKHASGAKKSAIAKLAAVNKPNLVPAAAVHQLPPVGTWKSLSQSQPILQAAPAQALTDLNAKGKRGRGTRPAAVREDKNNNAHYMWNIRQQLIKQSREERPAPETAAGRKTLLLEKRREELENKKRLELANKTREDIEKRRSKSRITGLLATQPELAPAYKSVQSPGSDVSDIYSKVISAFPLRRSKLPMPLDSRPITALPPPPPKMKQIGPARAKSKVKTTPVLPRKNGNAARPAAELTLSTALHVPHGQTGSYQTKLAPKTQIKPPTRKRLRKSRAKPKVDIASRLAGAIGCAEGPASASTPNTALQMPQFVNTSIIQYQASSAPITPDPAPKPKRTRSSRAKPQLLLPARIDNSECMVDGRFPNAQLSEAPRHPRAAIMLNTPVSVSHPRSHPIKERFMQSYDAQRVARFQTSSMSLFAQHPTPAQMPTLMYEIPHEVATMHRMGSSGTSNDATPRTRSGGYWSGHGMTRSDSTPIQPRHSNSQPKKEVRLPTPPSSDDNSLIDGKGKDPQLPTLDAGPPMTPKSRRIKKLGSISSILSSPPPQPPTLSRESQSLMEYPPPQAEEQRQLWDGYPDLDARGEGGPAKRGRARNVWCNYL